MKSFEERQAADRALIESARAHDEAGMRQALQNGANPNCEVEIQDGKKAVLLYDFCKNIKGKKGKKILDLLDEAGGHPQKRNAQRKLSPHHTFPKKVTNWKRIGRVLGDKEVKERNARLRGE